MLPGIAVACVGSFEWLLRLLNFCSKWQVRWCRLISCRRVFFTISSEVVGALIVETHKVGCGLCEFYIQLGLTEVFLERWPVVGENSCML